MHPPDFSAVARLGILGGTFDPIHYGHLAIAEEARQRFALDAVVFMPSGKPPHKLHEQVDAEHRYAMTVLATADHPHFFVSRMELERSGPSYTAETLRQVRGYCPQAKLYFLMGADMAFDFPTWRDPEVILDLAQVVAAYRAGYPQERLVQLLEDPTYRDITVMPAPGLDIASSDLRDRLRRGESIRYLTPDAVAVYIGKYGLYGHGK